MKRARPLRRAHERQRRAALEQRARPDAALDHHQCHAPRGGARPGALRGGPWRAPSRRSRGCASAWRSTPSARRRRAGSATPTSTSATTCAASARAGAGTLRDLLDLAQPIAMQAFDKDRPLWELYQVEGLEDGRSAIVMKLHHSVSDGVGLVRMTSSLVERSAEPRPPRPGAAAAPSVLDEPGPRGAFDETLRALQYRAGANLERTARAAGALRGGAARLLRDPARRRRATPGASPAPSGACCARSRSRSRRSCAGAPWRCASTPSRSRSRT